jgi:hypothetical protein
VFFSAHSMRRFTSDQEKTMKTAEELATAVTSARTRDDPRVLRISA